MKITKSLVLFGGTPAFQTPIYVGRPVIPPHNTFEEFIGEIFKSRFLTNNGTYLQLLEERIARLHKVECCVAVANGMLGLQLAIEALGMKGEVIVPSFTFVATVHAIHWQGGTPVFCDIDPETLTLDPQKVQALITKRTKGVIPVHVYGNPCHVRELERVCRARRIPLLFDAAHAFLCAKNGTSVGNFGDAEVLSFHATKFFSTFEGGAVLTNNKALAEKLRLLRNFGFSGYDTVVCAGLNAKLNEVSAAFGVALLPHIRDRVARGRSIYCRYQRLLAGLPGVSVHRFADDASVNYQYVPVMIDETAFGLSRDELYTLLWMENVRARRYFYPGCHEMEPYRSSRKTRSLRLPVTERVASQMLCLPTYFDLEDTVVSRIAGLIRHCYELRKEIKSCLNTK